MTIGFSAISYFTASLSRRVGMLALACLLVISSTAIQTHLHGVATVPGVGPSTFMSSLSDGNDDTDADHCLLCQAFVSGGGLLPVAIAAEYLYQFQHLNFHPATIAPAEGIAHTGWQGRAPPR